MQVENIVKMLKNKGLVKTPIRLAIFELFANSNVALAHGDIEKHFEGKFDRITIYRTLKTFQEKDIIHEVIDNTAIVKYALCKHDHTEAHEHHAHFKCKSCQQTYCIDDTLEIKVKLPEGFSLETYMILVTGQCKSCH